MLSLKLGKHAATTDVRDLKFGKYLAPALFPKRPRYVGHEDRMPLPRLMLGNGPDDSVRPGFEGAGDCVCAWICNMIRLSTAIAGKPARFTGKEAIDLYSAITGYVIGDDSTDNGTNMRDALNYWRKNGVKDADGNLHFIKAFASVDIHNVETQLEAIYLFDIGIGAGIVFPSTAMDEFNAGKPWLRTGKGPGHCIGWDAHRKYEFVETWGRDQKATANFMKRQLDEAWVVFTDEMLVADKSLEGFDTKALLADLAALGKA